MNKITLTNSFHNTKITVLSDHHSKSETWLDIQSARFSAYPTIGDKAKYKKVFNALCGKKDCCCGVVR